MKEKVLDVDVRLEEVQKPSGCAKYWHIYHEGIRAGKVYINIIEGQPVVSIELNQPHRNRGIGRIAVSRACFASQFPEVFATIRRSHNASLKMAEHAGFKPVLGHVGPQARLVWSRETAVSFDLSPSRT